MMINPVPAHDVAVTWKHIVQMVRLALENAASLEPAHAYRRSLIDGARQLWVIGAYDGIIITEIYATAKGLTCAIPIATGCDDHIEPGLIIVEAWARAEKCTRMEFIGRLGWQRRLKHQGWTPLTLTIEKELT